MNTKNKIAIALILGAGLLLGLSILLFTGKPGGAPEAETTAAAEAADEGDVHLSAEQIQAAGITLVSAGPGTVRSTLKLPGEIKFNEDLTAHVVARVSGVVEAVPAQLGQRVKKGQLLAVIASPAIAGQRAELATAQKRRELAYTTWLREKKLWEDKISAEQDFLAAKQALAEADIALLNAQQTLKASGAGTGSGGLNRFELRAPFDGLIVEKHLTLGEAVQENAQAFIVSDLSTVWATLNVPAKDLGVVRVGTRVTVRASDFDSESSGTVAYVGSLLGEQTRSATARVSLPNPDGAWRPGLFVSVEAATGEKQAKVVVPDSALQELEGQTVVFVRSPLGFRPQPVKTGGGDGRQTEILEGLKGGEQLAAERSFVLKAELGKSEAEHGH